MPPPTIMAATLAIGSLTVYAYREQIREFFIRVYEEYIVIEFKGEIAEWAQ